MMNNNPPLDDGSPFEFVPLLVLPESSRLTLDYIDEQADETLSEACRMFDVFPTPERRECIIDVCLHDETHRAARALARLVETPPRPTDGKFVNGWCSIDGWLVTSPN